MSSYQSTITHTQVTVQRMCPRFTPQVLAAIVNCQLLCCSMSDSLVNIFHPGVRSLITLSVPAALLSFYTILSSYIILDG